MYVFFIERLSNKFMYFQWLQKIIKEIMGRFYRLYIKFGN